MAIGTNWAHIADSIAFYNTLGYQYVEVPWVVPHDYNMVTCPDECYLVQSTVGELVGSAEQSFIYLDHQGKLGRGAFVTCTPCFRNEHPDELHQQGFMKVELYINNDTSDTKLKSLVDSAKANFEGIIWRTYGSGLIHEVKVVKTELGFDIEIGGIEVGSYGIREWNDLRWIYGTAIAEPRLSTTLHRLRHPDT